MDAKASLENGSKPLLLVGAGGGRQLLEDFQWCLLSIPGSLKKKKIDANFFSWYLHHMQYQKIFSK